MRNIWQQSAWSIQVELFEMKWDEKHAYIRSHIDNDRERNCLTNNIIACACVCRDECN
jgi:hypothetical protein